MRSKNKKRPKRIRNKGLTAEQLVQELARDRSIAMPVSQVRFHVRMGHSHGYPDCCIREYIRSNSTKLSADEEELMKFAGRRLCATCKARMLKQADFPHVEASRKLEAWVSSAHHFIFRIAFAKERDEPDQELIKKHEETLDVCIDQIARLKKAEKDLPRPY